MKTITALILLTLSTIAHAKDYGNVTVSEVRSIYDGDSFKVHITGWPPIIGESVSIRVRGVDTPEMRGKCSKEKEKARLAKQFTVEALRSAKIVELHKIERGKYFRVLATVMVDGVSLTDKLIQADLGRPYDGGRREGWCK